MRPLFRIRHSFHFPTPSEGDNMITDLTRRLTQLVGILIPSCAFTGLLVAQPSLRITSPAEGTVVRPGDSLTMTVEASPPGAFQLVFVGGSEPISYSKEKLTSPPYRFTIQIPSRIRPDKYALTAAGFTSPERQLVT